MIDRDIQARLLAFTSGRDALQSFQEWLAAIAWDAPEELEGEDLDVVLGVEHAMAEFTSDVISESQMKERIRALAHLGILIVLNAGGGRESWTRPAGQTQVLSLAAFG